MKILAFTDYHSGPNDEIEQLREKSRDVDLILFCGDLSLATGIGLEKSLAI